MVVEELKQFGANERTLDPSEGVPQLQKGATQPVKKESTGEDSGKKRGRGDAVVMGDIELKKAVEERLAVKEQHKFELKKQKLDIEAKSLEAKLDMEAKNLEAQRLTKQRELDLVEKKFQAKQEMRLKELETRSKEIEMQQAQIDLLRSMTKK